MTQIIKRDKTKQKFIKSKVMKSLQDINKLVNKNSIDDFSIPVEDINLKVAGYTEITIQELIKIIHTILKEYNYLELAQTYNLLMKINKDRPQLKVKIKKNKKTDTTDNALLVNDEICYENTPFDKQKIIDVLLKESNILEEQAIDIARYIEKKLLKSGMQTISTTLIRELVNNELLERGFFTRLEEQESYIMSKQHINDLLFSKSNENSNLTANNPEATNMIVAETILKQYALNNVFSKEVKQAHLSGRIHIHDLGTPHKIYCSSHSLDYIKKYGLKLEGITTQSSPAKHAHTLTGHLNTFLASMQSYYAGALGVAYVNIAYAPYLVGFTYEQMLKEAQYLIFSMGQSSFSRGGQVLFSDFNIHTGIPKNLEETIAIGPGGEYTGKPYKDYEKESQMFAKAILEVVKKGDMNGRIFPFPKIDFHITQNSFNRSAELDLLKYACEVASENGSIYFIFDRSAITLSACCRLKTTLDMANEQDKLMIDKPEHLRYCGFQNVTINLPQAAYRAGKGNIDGAIKDITDSMELGLKAHLQKKEFIQQLFDIKGSPLYNMGTSKKALDGFSYIDLQRVTYIFGMIGLNECIQVLIGKQLHEDDEAYKLGIRIISNMFLKTKEFSKRYNLKFALEESPAESAARRLAKVDLNQYPMSKDYVKGNIADDTFYYTNSIHFNAAIDMPIIERIEKQSKFHSLIDAGAIIHAFIGEKKPSMEAIFNLVKKTWDNTNCAQITISPEFTFCNTCGGMVRGLIDKCEYCGAENIEGIEYLN